MPSLSDAELVDVWVAASATYADAARALVGAGVPALAVLDAERRVVGLFTEDDLVAGLVPRYLRELRHTAFTEDDLRALAQRAGEAAGEPVTRHMSKPIVLERSTSATHAAERFLHGGCSALAVAEQGSFVGMLTQRELVRLLLARVGLV